MKKIVNTIFAILTAALLILLFIPNINIYIKGVVLIILSINLWIDVDLNSITEVLLWGRGGTDISTNKKIAINFTVFTIIFWGLLLLQSP